MEGHGKVAAICMITKEYSSRKAMTQTCIRHAVTQASKAHKVAVAATDQIHRATKAVLDQAKVINATAEEARTSKTVAAAPEKAIRLLTAADREATLLAMMTCTAEAVVLVDLSLAAGVTTVGMAQLLRRNHTAATSRVTAHLVAIKAVV